MTNLSSGSVVQATQGKFPAAVVLLTLRKRGWAWRKEPVFYKRQTVPVGSSFVWQPSSAVEIVEVTVSFE